MEEAIAILREQTVLCRQLLKLFGELSEALKANSLAMTDITKKIEPVIAQLNKNSARAQKFLTGVKAENFGKFLDAQPDSLQRTVAANLLKQSSNLQTQLKRRTEATNRLTANGSAFVAFSMNVLSSTRAGSTYGAEAQTGSRSGRRIFDENV